MRTIGVLALLLALSGAAFADGDVVELANGDHISGTIVKMEGEKLVVKTAYAGEVTIDWPQVTAIQSGTQHRVRLGTNEIVEARVVTKPDGVYLESDTMRSSRRSRLDEITSIDVPPVRWSGTLALLLNGSKGNTDALAFGLGAEAIRNSNNDRFRIGGRTDYEERDSSAIVQSSRGWLNYDYFLTSEWLARGAATLEHDKFKDLNLRTIVSAGPGYRFIHEKNRLLQAYVGFGYVNENFEKAADRDYVTALAGDEFRWPFNDRQSVYQLLDVYPSLKDDSDVLFQGQVGFRQQVKGGLFVDVGLGDDYDLKPAPGRKKNDLRYLTQLGYQF